MLNELKAANQELVLIRKEETDTAMRQDLLAFELLKPRLFKARRQRDQAAEYLKRHIREHGCT